MVFIPTTTATFYRGTTTNVDGDIVNADTPIASGVPVSITAKSRSVYMVNTGEPGNVTDYVGRVNPSFQVHVNDRLKDERTGVMYEVDDIVYGASLAQLQSAIMKLRVV